MKSPSITVQLIHIQGPMKGEIQEFCDDTVSIGRHPSCRLLFPADLTIVSRKHAEIIREGNRFRLVDASSNGTYVNGKKVTDCILREGDVIEFAEGGPKVSFLTRISADEAVSAKTLSTPAAVAPPVETPASEPFVKNPEPIPRQQPVIEPPPPEPPAMVAPPASVPASSAEPTPDEAVRNVQVPLIIQYGPTIRSFRELPVFIGKNPGCDFVLDHSGILDRHAQIFYFRDRYWLKDLTGQKMIRVNGVPPDPQVVLNANDRFSLGPAGPVFSFLGEGRIMEALDAGEEPVEKGAGENRGEKGSPEGREKGKSGGFWSRITGR